MSATRKLPALALAALAAAVPLAPAAGQPSPNGNIVTVAQYEGIRDPLQSDLHAIGVRHSLVTSGILAAYIETHRLEALNFLMATDAAIADADAVAITTNTVTNYFRAVDATADGGRLLIAKLKADLKAYEKRYPQFATADLANYKPDDTGEKRFWERYQAIKQGLREFKYEVEVPDPANPGKTVVEPRTLADAEKSLDEKAKAVRDRLIEIRDRLAAKKYALTHMREDGGLIAGHLEGLNQVVFGVQRLAVWLNESGKTPRNQFRATFSNKSPNMMFFVQIHAKDAAGNFAPRPDSLVPTPVYPTLLARDPANPDKKVWEQKPDLQNPPFGPRGPSEVWLPLNPGEKLVVRAATMGIVRDRIRTMPIKGKMVRPDANSYTRGFYYLGYEVVTPQGTSVSRWIPEEESYRWTTAGFLADSQRSGFLKLENTDAKTLRTFDPAALKLSQDRMECVLPSSVELMNSIAEENKAWAEVSGTAKFTKVGPKATQRTPITEEGSGKFEILVEKW